MLIVPGADSPGLHAHHGLHRDVGQAEEGSKLCIKIYIIITKLC